MTTETPKPKYALRQFDGRTVALEFSQNAHTFVFSGVGRYEHDPKLGDVLRILPAEVLDGQPEVFIQQDTWRGTVWRGEKYDVDFLFVTEPVSLPAPTAVPPPKSKASSTAPAKHDT